MISGWSGFFCLEWDEVGIKRKVVFGVADVRCDV